MAITKARYHEREIHKLYYSGGNSYQTLSSRSIYTGYWIVEGYIKVRYTLGPMHVFSYLNTHYLALVRVWVRYNAKARQHIWVMSYTGVIFKIALLKIAALLKYSVFMC